MLRLEDYKAAFTIVGFVGVLLFASPTLSLVLRLPAEEKFSELWILGPEHMIRNYPFNVEANETYLIYVGVANHLGSSAYYVAYVEFCDQYEPLPNSTTRTPSPLRSLYEYHIFLQDGKSWEAPLSFSFSGVSFFENQSLVKTIRINSLALDVDKSALWDVNGTGYYYQLFIELWIHDVKSGESQFHSRFVNLWLNMTG